MSLIKMKVKYLKNILNIVPEDYNVEFFLTKIDYDEFCKRCLFYSLNRLNYDEYNINIFNKSIQIYTSKDV